jgi:hypothetical protein
MSGAEYHREVTALSMDIAGMEAAEPVGPLR